MNYSQSLNAKTPVYCSLCVLALLISGCSVPADLLAGGGGVETTEGQITRGAADKPVKGASVTLAKVAMTATGDSIMWKREAITDKYGTYRINGVAPGRYVLFADDFDSPGIGIRSRLRKLPDTSLRADIYLLPPVNLKGRYIRRHPGAAFACIPILEACAEVGDDDVYILEKVPRGRYEIVFTSAVALNYLSLDLPQTGVADTVYLRDVNQALVLEDADGAYEWFQSDITSSFSVVPVTYREELEPFWYDDKDFTEAGYLSLAGVGDPVEWMDEDTSAVRVIFDTDLSGSLDDPSALVMLHALADMGEAEILAIMLSGRREWAAPAVDAFNTYYGRPDIPIGITGDDTRTSSPGWIQQLAQSFSNDITSGLSVPDAVEQYRTILSREPGRSVSIVCTGGQTNLAGLLDSPADEISPLTGMELVKQKVKHLTIMGGDYPTSGTGSETNLRTDPEASIKVTAEWPTPIMFSGREIVNGVFVGEGLKSLPAGNILRMTFSHVYGSDTVAWSSPIYDQTAVLYAVRGLASYWDAVTVGRNTVNPNGSNIWDSSDDQDHSYLVTKMELEKLKFFIEHLMMFEP